MAHELEQFSDGTTAFFTARQDAWHRLGTVTVDCLTAERGHADRLPRRLGRPHRGSAHRRVRRPVPNRYATTRVHPKTGQPRMLGLVGSTYRVVQNEEACQLLDLIVDETGAHYETAGSLRGGREVFVTMKLPETMRIAGVDEVDLYLAMCTSHDASRLGRVLISPTRIVCANTLRAAFADNVGEYTFRHSGDILGKLQDVRDALGLVPVYLDQFQEAAEKMIDKQLEWDQLQAISEQLWPLGDDDGESAYLKRMARERDLKHLFEQAPTQENIRGTALAGYNAVVEWLDHLPARPRR